MQTQRPVTPLAGRYALEERLGRSETGMAWRARDTLLGRAVALKLVDPRLADDETFSEHLADQARRIASLSHPGLARLYDTGREADVTFLVREHVEGTSARARLEREGPLDPDEAVRIATAVADALAAAHDAGVLHLGFGVGDVLIASDGEVRVTGLGIGAAITASRTPTEAAALLGGARLAPEQATGDVDERTDVFAVGAMVFELLTGRAPARRRSPRELMGTIPRALDRAVAHALAPDPAARTPSLRALGDELRAASSTAVRDPEPRGWLRTWFGVPVAILLVAAAAIATGLWVGRLEVGGPLGIRPVPRSEPPPDPAPTAEWIRPVSVSAFDPLGDGVENDSTAPNALDGDRTTAWRSENYFDRTLNKPGVGLVFDLGETRDVTGFRLSTPHGGFTVHLAVGDDPDALVGAIGPPLVAEEDVRGALSGSGRYVLLWVTSVVPVPDGNRAEVSEFRVVVRPA